MILAIVPLTMGTNESLSDNADSGVDAGAESKLVTAPFENILVPLDRDVIGKEGLERTLPIVQCCGATIHVLYVRWDPEFGVYKRDRLRYNPDADLERMGEQFRSDMEAQGQEVLIAHRRGTPQTEILRYVRENDIDLIIMSTHARTGLNLFLQGSVTQQVIGDSPVPVLVVKREANREHRAQ